MNRIFKFAHLVSLSVFWGSIITFIMISAMIENNTLENMAFGREIILKGTNILTLPAMWCLALSGILIGYSKLKSHSKFIFIKLVLAILVIINAHFFVAPAVNQATHIAISSIRSANLAEGYWAAYKKESIFGAINVLMIIIGVIVSIGHTKYFSQKNP